MTNRPVIINRPVHKLNKPVRYLSTRIEPLVDYQTFFLRLRHKLSNKFILTIGPCIRNINISNPASPSVVGTVDTPAQSYSLGYSGDHVYVADREGGMVVVDISIPTNPTIVAKQAMDGYVRDVLVIGDRAYAVTSKSGASLNVVDKYIYNTIGIPSDKIRSIGLECNIASVSSNFR